MEPWFYQERKTHYHLQGTWGKFNKELLISDEGQSNTRQPRSTLYTPALAKISALLSFCYISNGSNNETVFDSEEKSRMLVILEEEKRISRPPPTVSLLCLPGQCL